MIIRTGIYFLRIFPFRKQFINILYFQVLENEIFKFEEQFSDFVEYLNNGVNIPDDVRDKIFHFMGRNGKGEAFSRLLGDERT